MPANICFFITILSILPIAKKAAMCGILREMKAIFAGSHPNVGNIINLCFQFDVKRALASVNIIKNSVFDND